MNSIYSHPHNERQAGACTKPHVGSSWRVIKQNMRHELTALQYLQIIQSLPNPCYHYGEMQKGGNALPIYRVAYLPYNLNQTPIELSLPNSATMPLLQTKEIEFELVPNANLWFWQPVNEITIVRIEKGQMRRNW